MSTARYHVGHVLDVVASLPDGSVDLVLTSPPFLALRAYLPDGHPLKPKEMGSEPTPSDFIDGQLDVVEALRPKLAPHGSMAIEFGDTYAGSGGGGGDYLPGGLRESQNAFGGSATKAREANAAHWRQKNEWRKQAAADAWPLEKSLCLIPEMFRISLAYGLNPLTGRETERWRIRNVIRWARPNPPVGALGDKFRPATSDMVVFCAGTSRYFDLDAVRTPSDYDRPNLRGKGARPGGTPNGQRPNCSDHTSNPAGAPPLDWWEPTDDEAVLWEQWADEFGQQLWVIPTKPYKGSHYATWPPALCERPVKAMCPERVCLECGAPSERIVEPTPEHAKRLGRDMFAQLTGVNDRTTGRHGNSRGRLGTSCAEYVTLGWTCCGCGDGCRATHYERRMQVVVDDNGGERRRKVRVVVDVGKCDGSHWRRGVVLDPFAGSGTTLMVATGHGRDAIGIDIDERNVDLARERIGMFLEVAEEAPRPTTTVAL